MPNGKRTSAMRVKRQSRATRVQITTIAVAGCSIKSVPM